MRGKERKDNYFQQLTNLLQEYSKIFIVDVTMVGSKQIQNVRNQLRGKGELLFGKNTMIRKCIRDNLEEMPHLEPLLNIVEGNTGFLFVKDEFSEIRRVLNENFVGAGARAGVIAPLDVDIPAGVTGLQPTETNFFQALNISTKITKGSIEILQNVELIKAGRKVQPGEAVLLQKLGIKPFTYGLVVVSVYEDGQVYDAKVLDITDNDLKAAFMTGMRYVAALCLGAHYPTVVSVPHTIVNGYKNVLGIALVSDYTFPRAQKLKDFLSDPEAIARAAAAAAAPAAGAGKVVAKAAEPESEEEEEEEADFDLFD